MTDIKLAKNRKVVKFPATKSSVRGTLHDAMMLAVKEKWVKVIVIGESPEKGHWFYSAMTPPEAVGMIEGAKYLIQKDVYR